ncbi:ABC transporter permease [Natronomonas sp. F2-12]|uniref:ABC transporter permease n=2 Tax=Natronomonas aquatica TaxID=2841590 RepID=A0A9R1CTZ4_9EURY|nr:ABC transporter permease [Natronomonas aquatica]
MSGILNSEMSSEREEQIDNLKRLWSRFTANTLTVVGTLIVVSVIFAAIFAPYIAPYPQHAEGGVGSVDNDNRLAEPSTEHLMGTDDSGRDIFSRVLYGARISLQMMTIALTLSISVGGTLGLVAGMKGGITKVIIMRTADTFMSIPALVLAMVVAGLLEPNLYISMVAVSVYWWTLYCRLVQGEVNSIKEEEFVEADRALGSPWYNTAVKEILPNIITPVLVKATIDAGFIILLAAGLGFLGLGTQPPTPDWGVMVAQGRDFVLTSWWVSTLPGLAIAYTVYGFNLLGDGLRDVFDVEVDVNE